MKREKVYMLVSIVVLCTIALFVLGVRPASLVLPQPKEHIYFKDSASQTFYVDFTNTGNLEEFKTFYLLFDDYDYTQREYTQNLADIFVNNQCIGYPSATSKSACCGAYGNKVNYAEVGNGARAYSCFKDVPVKANIQNLQIQNTILTLRKTGATYSTEDIAPIVNAYCIKFSVNEQCRIQFSIVNINTQGAVNPRIIYSLQNKPVIANDPPNTSCTTDCGIGDVIIVPPPTINDTINPSPIIYDDTDNTMIVLVSIIVGLVIFGIFLFIFKKK